MIGTTESIRFTKELPKAMSTNVQSSAERATDTQVVLLGTSGGPRWWSDRAGIATAVVVGESFYLFDCGSGVGRQLRAAGLDIDRLRGVFITHMHSDHVVDLAGLGIFGMFGLEDHTGPVIPVVGPGDRGAVVPASPRATADPGVLYPQDPTPGIAGYWDYSMRANATDLNDRYRDSLRPSPDALFEPREITLPTDLGFHPDHNPVPAMDPVVVYSDELVTVTAILVQHPPVAPAYAFRIDTPDGSVTISGDTAPCENLVRLARGTDVLLHEVIDEEWIAERYGDAGTPEAQTMIDHHLNAHTGIPDTGRIATEAGVGTLVLHHFVPGNRPRDRWETACRFFDGTVVVGDDLMEIPVRAAASRPVPEGQLV
ncbi:metallo-beta-lactamase [Rhodococcus opacus]|uniref:Metallo-beta-lactamase n=2 Tax=Rhodococcus opacus TaxID=37919 RepID=A0A1B1KEY0_RHOOP|nr:metallo-beta-lactamase [Rhodococcus opacus]